MMRCVLVDDEPIALERLAALLTEAAIGAEIVGTAGSGKEAIPLIYEAKPDVVFLDVQMPVLDGFDVVDLLRPPRPHIVFVTAYDEYALRAFEVHALDYLTKPVRLRRLNQTLERLQALTATASDALDALRAERAAMRLNRLTVQVGRRLRVIEVPEIQWVEARDKLVFAHLDGGTFPIDFTLDELEKRLDPEQFVRIHRAYLVNLSAVHELVPTREGGYRLRMADATPLPVARRRARAVKSLLSGG